MVGTPTLSQVRSWDSDHLGRAATQWMHTADAWDDAFDSMARQMAAPGGEPWSGDAADAAQASASLDRSVVHGLSAELRTAAMAARGAAGEIDAAKRAALHAVGEAHAEGFIVGDDLALTDQFSSTSSEELAARRAQAHTLSADIHDRAAALAAVDQIAAETIAAAAAGLREPSFGTGPIQLVDFHGVPVPESPSWTSPEPPPGGWSADPVTRAAQKIAYGHASTKHLATEWPPGTTREQLAREVERIMRAGTNPNGGMTVGLTRDGAPAIYDPKTNTLVIRDRGAADAGTVFRPARGEQYVAQKLPTRLPSLSPAELADASGRPIAGGPPVLDSGGAPDVGLPGAGR